MKVQWKKTIILLVVMTIVLTFSGCGVTSNFNEPNSQAETADPSTMEEIDLNAMLHGEEGYYYKDLKCGLMEEEIEAVLGYDIGRAEVMANGKAIRYNPTIRYKMGDQIPTSVELICGKDGKLAQVAFQFERRNADDNLEAFQAQLMEQLTAIYGPQTSTDEDSQEVGEVTMKTVTNKWEKALANGNVTSLQVATAATGEKYDVVVLGVTCYNPEDLSEEAVE